jgi:hypothetical protein
MVACLFSRGNLNSFDLKNMFYQLTLRYFFVLTLHYLQYRARYSLKTPE